MEFLKYFPGGLLFAWAITRTLRDYRGNALVTLGTITLATAIGFGMVIESLPRWFADGFIVVVLGGLALATLFLAVWRPPSRGGKPSARRKGRI
jgi:hypothetical protein